MNLQESEYLNPHILKGMNNKFSSIRWGKALLALIVIYLLLCYCNIPEPACISPFSPLYQESLNRSVKDIFNKMTIKEKIGQLFLVYFEGATLSHHLKEMINYYHIGGIILYDVSGNIENPVQLGNLINMAQAEALKHGAKIPLFVAIDQEGGRVVRLTKGATVFPGNMAVGATGSLKDASLMAMITAKELKAIGINMNLAPVIDVNNNPDNPVIGTRSFGSSADEVSCFGTTMIKTFNTYSVICTAKHFPGHGDTTMDSHIGLPIIDHPIERLERIEFFPFKKAIEAGVPAIMTAHVVMPAIEKQEGMPATLSYHILTELLRKRMGFDGLIITDSLGMGAIEDTFSINEAAVMALNAGADILLFGADKNHPQEDQIKVFNHILSSVQTGQIPLERLNESVKRILKAKIQYGIFDSEQNNTNEIPLKVGIEKHRAIAQLIAENGITLIKDEKGFLPVESKTPVFCIWPRIKGRFENGFDDYDSKMTFFPISIDPNHSEIDSAINTARDYLCIIVGTYDVRQHPKQIKLVDDLSKLDTDMIVVSIKMPYDILCFPYIPCYMATYGTRSLSLHALAEIIFGQKKPRGRIPVDLPGLYPIGHGLIDFKSRQSNSI